MPIYPTAIPDSGDYPDRVDDVDWIKAARYNEIKKEVIAICAELGISPSGSEATVAARLTALTPIQSTYVVTITPATSGTVTLNDDWKTAGYIKIGQLVHVQGGIVIASIDSPVGDLKLNLPFASASLLQGADNSAGPIAAYGINFDAAYLTTFLDAAWNYFKIAEIKDNAGYDFLEGADLAGGGAEMLFFSLTYFAAA